MLPEFPKTPHLPYKSINLDDFDVISDDSIDFLFNSPNVIIEEKIDGSNMGMMLKDGHPVLRNREHILNKGYLKDTPAKMQFRPAWNYFYENKSKFEKLNKHFGYPVGVYGEWCLAVHGLNYTLPDYFIAFDIYDSQNHKFINSIKTRSILEECGFICPPLLYSGSIPYLQFLDLLVQNKSAWSEEKIEGIYIKDSDENNVLKRFKMVREDFKRNSGWSKTEINRQKIIKK